jgi:hypothetical protein
MFIENPATMVARKPAVDPAALDTALTITKASFIKSKLVALSRT